MLVYSAQEPDASGSKHPAHHAVYRKLRDMILFGDFTPGQQVTIQGISDALDAGMTPVREAIRRLTSDGALNMLGNRRVIVPELTAGCIEDLEFMRLSLEPVLAGRAVPNILPEMLETLHAEDEALNRAIDRGDIPGYLTHNYRFHASLYAAAGAPIIAATVDRLWLRFGPSLRVVCGRFGTMNLPDKHADLLAALRSGDTAGAEQAVREDVQQGMAQIRETLRFTAPGDRFD